MVGVTVVSKLLLVPNYPLDSRYFSAVISLCSDDFIPIKSIMLARSGEEELALVFFYSLGEKNTPFYTQHILNAPKATAIRTALSKVRCRSYVRFFTGRRERSPWSPLRGLSASQLGDSGLRHSKPSGVWHLGALLEPENSEPTLS